MVRRAWARTQRSMADVVTGSSKGRSGGGGGIAEIISGASPSAAASLSKRIAQCWPKYVCGKRSAAARKYARACAILPLRSAIRPSQYKALGELAETGYF